MIATRRRILRAALALPLAAAHVSRAIHVRRCNRPRRAHSLAHCTRAAGGAARRGIARASGGAGDDRLGARTVACRSAVPAAAAQCAARVRTSHGPRQYRERVSPEDVVGARMHVPPDLPFGWFDAPPSIDRLLGVQWLAKLLYPHAFPEPLAPRVKAFHKLFYHPEPTDAQVSALLERAGVR
jgi:hypothetical protein